MDETKLFEKTLEICPECLRYLEMPSHLKGLNDDELMFITQKPKYRPDLLCTLRDPLMV